MFSLFRRSKMTDTEKANARVMHHEDVIDEQAAGFATEDDLMTGGSVTPEELEMVRSGNKITAIKSYQQRTGVSLKEAHEVIGGLNII